MASKKKEMDGGGGGGGVAVADVGTRMIPLSQVSRSALNRTIAEDDESTRSLAASMLSHGQLQPIVLRSTGPEAYEIVCGERRVVAARSLGWSEIEAKVVDADEQTAQVMRIIENLQRVDVPPLEQSEGVAQLLRQYAGDAVEVARRLGVSRSWVYLRAKLRDLSPAWRNALAPENLGTTRLDAIAASVRMQELLAALPVAMQDALLDDPLTRTVRTVARLQELIAERMRVISEAPWSTADEKKMRCDLASRCASCEQRTDRERHLFSEVFAESSSDDARCLDEGCWALKMAAFKALSVRKAQDANPGREIVLLTNGWSGHVEGATFTNGVWRAGADLLGLPIYEERFVSFAKADAELEDRHASAIGVWLDGPRIGHSVEIWVEREDEKADTQSTRSDNEQALEENDDGSTGSSDAESDRDAADECSRRRAEEMGERLLGLIASDETWPSPSLSIYEDEPDDDHCQIMTALHFSRIFGLSGLEDESVTYAKVAEEFMKLSRQDVMAGIVAQIRRGLKEDLKYGGRCVTLDTEEDVMLLARDLGYSRTLIQPLTRT